MIKRTNKILSLIICATTVTALCPSLKAVAAETLQEKEGNFTNAIAYSNKYLYYGSRGDDEEKTVLYSKGKYKELEDADAYEDSEKYGNKYIELEDDNSENLLNLQTGKFEDESIEDKEFDIKRKLIKELKDTDRYGEDVAKYFNLDKRISTNKESFGDVWYQYSVDYNGADDENTRYITTINLNTNSNDEWDNITLKKGTDKDGSLFGDQYQFWFSITANEPDNKDLDGQGKTFNGDVEAASRYIAGRLRDYSGCEDVRVITVNGKARAATSDDKVVIQVVSTKPLDGDVIVGHNNDISISTKKTNVNNIPENPDELEVPEIPVDPEVPGTPVEPGTPGGSEDNDETKKQYRTIININNEKEHEWKHIKLKKGDGITSEKFGDEYDFWFSIIANDPGNKDEDGQGKTFNGDVEAASEYIAGRLRDYCGYGDVEVIQIDENIVIEVISDKNPEESILDKDSEISVETKETTVDNIPENPDEPETPVDPEVPGTQVELETPVEPETPGGSEDTGNSGGSEDNDENKKQYITTINLNNQKTHEWKHINLKKGDGIESDFGDTKDFWFSIIANDSTNIEDDGEPKTFNGDVEAASNYIAKRLKEYCGYDDVEVIQVDENIVIKVISDRNPEESILDKDSEISVETLEPEETNTNEEDTPTVFKLSSMATSPESVIIDGDSENAKLYGSSAALSVEGDLPVYYGIVNDSGKYMDISNYANIKFIYKVDGEVKTADIEEFGKKYGDENVIATLKSLDILAQDSSYVYARVNVEFSADRDIDIVYADGENSKEYILKISKSVGNKVDGAYTPKKVEAYEMNGESDFKSWIQPKINDDWYNLDIFAKNENLYIVRFNKDGVNNKNEIQCIQVNFQTKRDDYLRVSRNKIGKVCDPSVSTRLKNRKIETTDADEIRALMKQYYSIDSEGELWVLGLKRIYKLNGGGFNEEFIVPVEIHNLDVYNKSNLVAWGDDGNDDYVYVTNINEYENDSNEDSEGNEDNDSAEKDFDESDYEVNIAKGWLETKLGWKYFDQDGNQVKNSWIKVNEKWYLINENGIMMTGWVDLNQKRYYLNEDGSMAVGWKKINDKWYYLQSDGSMATKWKSINGSWYYLNESGEMAIGWVNDSGNWYHLGTDGAMSTGWLKYNKKWYYLNESGRMLSNTTINGYKLGSDGTLI